MGSPEKPLDVEMGDVSDETNKLNPDVKTENGIVEGSEEDTRFTGLKKEELLAISNQPKWVRARWVLFIIFWLAWIGMLVGAILIVVNAPKCKPEPKPQWYQDTVVYEVNVKEFAKDFKGLEAHLSYIESLKAETIIIAGAADPTDQTKVLGNSDEFNNLITAANTKSMKVVIDLTIDTMSTANPYFSQSAQCIASPPGEKCNFFVCRGNDSLLDVSSSWMYDSTRNEYCEVVPKDNSSVFINYGDPDAVNYLESLVEQWIKRKVHGVHLRDTYGIRNNSLSNLLSAVWNKHFVNQNETRALFSYSAPNDNIPTYPNQPLSNTSNTDPAPVSVTANFATKVGKPSNTGKMIQAAIEEWRNGSRNIGSYTISPLNSPLAATKYPNNSAGLVVLSIALPGVPVIRSGDEVGLSSAIFNWSNSEDLPVGASDELKTAVLNTIVRRVEGIQAMQSLRFDTRDADTQFNFIDTGSPDVVAFIRKWSTKPSVLVVSNLSPNSGTVNVAKPSGLKNSDGKTLDKAKVLVSSAPNQPSEVELNNLQVDSGVTLLIGE